MLACISNCFCFEMILFPVNFIARCRNCWNVVHNGMMKTSNSRQLDKNCSKKLWKNAPISALGYGASKEEKRKFKKPRSLAQISEHFFTIFSNNFCSIQARHGCRVTCSFTVTYDVTFPWPFGRLIPSLHIENLDIWDSNPLVFPRLICKIIFIGECPRLAGYFINCLYTKMPILQFMHPHGIQCD